MSWLTPRAPAPFRRQTMVASSALTAYKTSSRQDFTWSPTRNGINFLLQKLGKWPANPKVKIGVHVYIRFFSSLLCRDCSLGNASRPKTAARTKKNTMLACAYLTVPVFRHGGTTSACQNTRCTAPRRAWWNSIGAAYNAIMFGENLLASTLMSGTGLGDVVRWMGKVSFSNLVGWIMARPEKTAGNI